MLDPAILKLPFEKMRAGYYSDENFVRAQEVCVACAVDGMQAQDLWAKAPRDAT